MDRARNDPGLRARPGRDSARRGLLLQEARGRALTGFSIHPAVVPEAECTGLLAAVGAGDDQTSRAGSRHLLSHPAVASIANDPRLVSLAAAMLGSRAVPFKATLFSKTGRANWLVVWHQDTALPLTTRLDEPGWGPWSVKERVTYAHAPAWALESVIALRLHLDDSTEANGPLRVIPGSHRLGVLTDRQILRIAADGTPASCVAPRGSVVTMRPLLVHASSKSASPAPRRVLHIEYAQSRELRPGITLAVA